MDKINIIFFVISIVIFILFSIIWGRFNLKEIFSSYFSNYKGGHYIQNGKAKRKTAIAGVIALGIFPYVLGVTFFLSFESVIMSIDMNMLLQINIIFMTILCLFYGFHFNIEESKKELFNETFAAIIVDIILIILACFTLILANVFSNMGDLQINNEDIIIKFTFSIFWAMQFKISILFLYIVRRIHFFKKK